MTEEWRDVEGYTGVYQVSSIGRVRSLDRTVLVGITGRPHYKKVRGRNLTPKLDRYGYLTLTLCSFGSQKSCTVHRLVAMSFIPRKTNTQVNHKNLVKTDNRVCNLEWVTTQYNTQHSLANGHRVVAKGSELPQSKLTEKCVKEILRGFKKSDGLGAWANKYGVSKATISLIVLGRTWKHLTRPD